MRDSSNSNFFKQSEMSAETLQSLTEQIEEAFWLIDPETNEVMYANPAFEKMTAINSEDLYHNSRLWLDAIHPDDRERATRNSTRNIFEADGKLKCNEYRIVKPDGSILWVLIKIKPVYDEFGKIIIKAVTAVDITDTIRAEEKMRESAKTLEIFFKYILDPAAILDKDFNFIRVNDAYAKADDKKPEEFIGKNHFEMYPSDAKDIFEEVVRTKKPYVTFARPFEYAGNPERGITYWDWSLVPILNLNNDVEMLIFSLRNVTQRQRDIIALNSKDNILEAVSFASEQFLKSSSWTDSIQDILDKLGAATKVSRIYVFENHEQDNEILTSQKYEWVAKGIESQMNNPDLHDFRLMEYGFKRWVEVLSNREMIAGFVKDFPESEKDVLEPQEIKSIVIAPIFVENHWWGFIGFDETKSEHYWSLAEVESIKAAASIIGAAIQQDRAKDEIFQSRKNLQNLVDSNPDHITIYRNDGFIEYVREPEDWERNISLEHKAGRFIWDIHDQEFAQKIYKGIKIALQTKELQTTDFTIERNGNVFYYEVRYVALDEKRVVATLRNITKIKKLEQEILKMQKLESVGILAGGIAHDFNNILTGVLGNISLALNEDSREKIEEYLLEAENAIIRAKSLTKQLLTFSKGGIPVKETVAIAELIKEFVSFSIRGSKVKAEFDIKPNLPNVEIDADQINQAISNIVLNALQAMPNGGTINISIKDVNITSVNLLPLDNGPHVIIKITDHGIGIKSKHLKKIFDPYFTTKQTGSGLGLASTYSIIKHHNGHIDVVSEIGAGTSFTIYLPATDREVTRQKKEKLQLLRGTGKILVLDDEDFICELSKRILKEAGYEVETIQDGNAAIELYREALKTDKPFDLVLLDLTVPGSKGGKEVIQELLETDPNTKGIVCSGYSNDPIMAKFEEYGFKGVVAKPFKINELTGAVHSVINNKNYE